MSLVQPSGLAQYSEIVIRGWLNRFNKKEIFELLKDQNIPVDQINELKSKKASVNELYNKFFKNLSNDELALLDLKYFQARPTQKKWQAYRLTQSNNKQSKSMSPKQLQFDIHNALKPFFDTHVYVTLFEQAYWIRIHTTDLHAYSVAFSASSIASLNDEEQIASLAKSSILVYHPRSTLILASHIKAEVREIYMQCVMLALGCTQVEEMSLIGRDLRSLSDLVLFSSSQGKFSELRTRSTDDKPLSRKVKKVKKNNKHTLYGVDKLPVLNSITLHLKNEVDTLELKTTVIFAGISVLDGIEELVEHGVMDSDAPQFIRDLPHLAANTVMVDS